jgi:hypothetical protein
VIAFAGNATPVAPAVPLIVPVLFAHVVVGTMWQVL